MPFNSTLIIRVSLFTICVALFAIPAQAQQNRIGHSFDAHTVHPRSAQPLVVQQRCMTPGCSCGHGYANSTQQFSIGRFNVQIEPIRLGDIMNIAPTKNTLPTGRRYLEGGRYFGTVNNRFYGPQYGNF